MSRNDPAYALNRINKILMRLYYGDQTSIDHFWHTEPAWAGGQTILDYWCRASIHDEDEAYSTVLAYAEGLLAEEDAW